MIFVLFFEQRRILYPRDAQRVTRGIRAQSYTSRLFVRSVPHSILMDRNEGKESKK